MILKNPTLSEVSIGILGTEYSIPAGESITVSEQVGNLWLKIHSFLEVLETEEPKVEVKDELDEVIKDLVEEKEVKEVKEKKPTKPITKTKK